MVTHASCLRLAVRGETRPTAIQLYGLLYHSRATPLNQRTKFVSYRFISPVYSRTDCAITKK
jgi:hypothetical protein